MARRDAVEFAGVLAMALFALAFATVWWGAYLAGGRVDVTVAAYGEQYVEAALWFVLAPLMVFAFASYLERLTDS